MLWANSNRIALAILAVACLCGCEPVGPGATDEEKEPQFLIGRSRVNAMNYSGAIEAFERALEMNPQSGAAHFELGWLYAEKQTDEAAAIYHYQKYLKLRPHADNAETIQQHVLRLKQELAKAALPIAPASEIQRQLEQLMAENRRLQSEVDQLQKAVVQTQGSSPLRAPVNQQSVSRPLNTPPESRSTNTVRNISSRSTPTPTRSHRVQAGETPAAIARRYNVSVDALLAANPGVNPRRIQVGQILTVPPR